jgi:hypothetical protein
VHAQHYLPRAAESLEQSKHGADRALNATITDRHHAIDPFAYLDEVLRVLPYWPHDRYLELAPPHWLATRARLDSDQLALPIAAITVPPPQSE